MPQSVGRKTGKPSEVGLFAVMAAAAAVSAAGALTIRGRDADRPWPAALQACLEARQVSAAHAVPAFDDLAQAHAARRAALQGGSLYASAKLGVPPGSPEWMAAEAAQAQVAAAEARVRALCG